MIDTDRLYICSREQMTVVLWMLNMASDGISNVSAQRVQLCQVILNGEYEYFLEVTSIADPDPSPKPECIKIPK